MFSSWSVEDHTEKEHESLAIFKADKLDKICFPRKAQQKLASTISASLQDLLIEEHDFINNKPTSFIAYINGFEILIPSLNAFKENEKTFSKLIHRRWPQNKFQSFTELQSENLKESILRESAKFAASSKLFLESCVGKKFCDVKLKEYPVIKPNKLIFDVSFGLSFPKHENNPRAARLEPCFSSTSLNPENVLSQKNEVSDLDSLLVRNEKLGTIPPFLFLGDNLIEKPLIRDYQQNPYFSIQSESLASWKYKIPWVWKVDQVYLDSILDEPIKKLELKYRLPLRALVFPLISSQLVKSFCKTSVSKEWFFSEYNTDIMDWKPFGKLQLENFLDEDEGDIKITISSIVSTDDDERYSRLYDIESNCNILSACNYASIPVKAFDDNEISPLRKLLNSLTQNTKKIFSSCANDGEADSTISINSYSNEAKSSSTDVLLLTILDANPIGSIQGEWTSTKRTISESTTIISKKRKKEIATQSNFSKR